MADPFHGNRYKKQEAAQAAYQKAVNIPKPRPDQALQALSADYPWDTKKVYLHPVHKYQMNEWEYNLLIQEEKDKEAERVASASSDKAEAHGGVRENQQYTLALKTAFELGMNAGLMQRPPPPPCNACERRKERNRIAAQTSRVEKRRLELMQPPRRDVVGRIVRSTAGIAPPAPTYPSFDDVPPMPASTSASTASKVDHERGKDEEVEDEDEEEEDADETEIHPPPF